MSSRPSKRSSKKNELKWNDMHSALNKQQNEKSLKKVRIKDVNEYLKELNLKKNLDQPFENNGAKPVIYENKTVSNSQHNKMQTEIKELKIKQDKCQKDLMSAKEESRKKIQKKIIKINEYKANIDTFKTQKLQLKQECEIKRKSRQTSLDETKGKLNKLSEKHAETLKKIENLNITKTEQEEKFRNANAKNTLNKNNILTEHNQKIESLQNDLKNKSILLEEISARSAKCENEQTTDKLEFEKSILSYQTKIQELELRASENTLEIQKYKDKIDAEKTESSRKITQLQKDQKTELTQKDSQISQADTEHKSNTLFYKNEIFNINQAHQNKKDSSNTEMETLRTHLKECSNQTVIKNNALQKLQNEYNQHEETISKLTATLESKSTEHKLKISELEKKSNEHNTTILNLRAEINRKSEENRLLIHNSQSNLNKSEKTIEDLQKDLQISIIEKNKVKDQITASTMTYVSSVNEIQKTLESKSIKYQAEFDKNATLSNQLKTQGSKLEAITVENTNLKEYKDTNENIKKEKNSAFGILSLMKDTVISDDDLSKIIAGLSEKNKNSEEIFRKFVNNLDAANVNLQNLCREDLVSYLKIQLRIKSLHDKLTKMKGIAQKIPDVDTREILEKRRQTSQQKIDILMEKFKTPISEQEQANPSQNICNNIHLKLENIGNEENYLKELEYDTINLNEDLGGAVRVYVRIFDESFKYTQLDKLGKNKKKSQRNYFSENITMVDRTKVRLNYTKFKPTKKYFLQEKKIKFEVEEEDRRLHSLGTMCLNSNGDYSPFFEVFDKGETNQQVFSGSVDSGESSSYKEFYGPNNILNEGGRGNRGGIYKTVAQLQDGYSIVLSGYGLSGSGKTYTLFGNDAEPGLLYSTLANLQNVESFTIDSVFEEYQREVKWADKNFTVNGKIIYLFGQKFEDLKNSIARSLDTKLETNSLLVKDCRLNFKTSPDQNMRFRIEQNVQSDDFIKQTKGFLNKVTKYRQAHSRIRATPNNDESSRSHLYIVFNIKFKNNKQGYLTIVDQAGKEDPFLLHSQLFFNKENQKNQQDFESVLLNSSKESLNESFTPSGYRQSSATAIVKESMYINESLFNLKLFYRSKRDSVQFKNYVWKPEKQSVPSDETQKKEFLNSSFSNINMYLKNVKADSQLQFTKQKNSTTILMKKNTISNLEEVVKSKSIILTIPIMQYFDNLSKTTNDNITEYRPSKFVFLLAVRTAGEYCADTASTLKFGLEISK